MLRRLLESGTLLVLFYFVIFNSQGEELPVVVIEMRRTFNTLDCVTGEVYIGAELAAFFSASPSSFSSYLSKAPARLGTISTEDARDPFPYLKGKVPGLRFKSDSVGIDNVFYFTEARSFTIYDRPRKLSRPIPSEAFILGTSLENRECRISSPEESTYFAIQGDFTSSAIILKKILYGAGATEDKLSRKVVLIYTDASNAFEIKSDNMSYRQNRPIRGAENLSKDDFCLSKIEDSANTIISPNGQTYQRRDDVWFCTEGPLVMKSLSTSAIEKRSDLRYIELQTYESCGTVLGIPVGWQVVAERDHTGRGGAIWYRCFLTEPWQQISKVSTITFQ